MSLLQGVLRSQADAAAIENRLNNISLTSRRRSNSDPEKDDSDDELINVVSLPGSPARTRPSSPTRSSSRPVRGPLHISSSSKRDPLKAFPTEVSQRIFSRLVIKDLATCSLVSRKWNKSQTVNYVWFQHYRRDNFHDTALPPGKWTKRESKQNWRLLHLLSASHKEDRSPTSTSGWSNAASGYSSPRSSGYQTPKEIREEKWRQEAEAIAKPGKLEMREMYKELGGRKAKTKTKLGSSGGVRDKGGWSDMAEW